MALLKGICLGLIYEARYNTMLIFQSECDDITDEQALPAILSRNSLSAVVCVSVTLPFADVKNLVSARIYQLINIIAGHIIPAPTASKHPCPSTLPMLYRPKDSHVDERNPYGGNHLRPPTLLIGFVPMAIAVRLGTPAAIFADTLGGRLVALLSVVGAFVDMLGP